MPTDRPIIDHKQAFLHSQVRVLSAPLRVPQPNPYPDSSAPALPASVSEDILAKVNKRITTHARTTFPPNTQRHVAEQIDTLFWRDVLALPGVGPGKPDPNLTVVGRDVDLTSSDAVSKLPETLGEARLTSGEVRPEDAQEPVRGGGAGEGDEERRYADLRTKLLEETRKREELQKKIAGYRQLQELLKPFENAKENVQPNLVTRDGELSRELDKMRMLLARVGAKAAEFDGQEDRKEEAVAVRTEEAKLAYVLGLG